MSDELVFLDEDAPDELMPDPDAPVGLSPYKLLVVDDDEEIHTVTKLVLRNFRFEGSPLEVIHTYSSTEAKDVLQSTPDIAVILLDVVMESDHAGLDLTRWIRNTLRNAMVRIVLRTGQPGQAPEYAVVEEYDINDYKAKTELTSLKMHTLLFSCLRSYRDLLALERSRRGLKQVLKACRGIYVKHELEEFIHGALQQLCGVLPIYQGSMVLSGHIDAFTHHKDTQGLDSYVFDQGETTSHHTTLLDLDPEVQDLLVAAVQQDENIFHQHCGVIHFASQKVVAMFVIYYPRPLDEVEKELLNIFTETISSALQSIYLKQIIQDNQREIIIRLTEVVENRSKETGNHIRRVALYSELLAKKYGLPDEDVQILKYASPLHDIGKVAIPDAVLNKPGKLDDEEWHVMQQHASKGMGMLENSDIELLRAGSIIAGQHHERWDGEGYPDKLSGEDIHIYGRITAVADVFDALLSKRCYKESWSIDQVIDYFKEASGKQFQPALVSILLDDLNDFVAILDAHPD